MVARILRSNAAVLLQHRFGDSSERVDDLIVPENAGMKTRKVCTSDISRERLAEIEPLLHASSNLGADDAGGLGDPRDRESTSRCVWSSATSAVTWRGRRHASWSTRARVG
jgi:hypothetical protein